LPKPVEAGNEKLVKKFSDFLKAGRNISLLIQIAVSINVKADAFITNDVKLKQIEESKVIVLKDYL
jgi:hypothetical protein